MQYFPPLILPKQQRQEIYINHLTVYILQGFKVNRRLQNRHYKIDHAEMSNLLADEIQHDNIDGFKSR